MAARFCAGGFIFMPRLGALYNHHLASRKKRTADSILSRDSFNYHLVLKQQPTQSAISPVRRDAPSPSLASSHGR